jgi:hypothetical protein
MEARKISLPSLTPAVMLAVLTACAQQTGGIATPPSRVDQVRVESQHIDFDITSKVEASEARATVQFPAAAVWRALPRAYSDLAIPVETLDPAHRFLAGAVTARRTFAGKSLSQFVDCGSTAIGPNANSYNVRLRIQTQADSTDAGESSIRSLITSTAASDGGITVRCGSKGDLERLIVARTVELLR